MSAVALLGFLILSGVEVGIAPDQPLPYVYMDDPVILELRSDRDATVDVNVRVQARYAEEPVDLQLEELTLRAQGDHWEALDDFPSVRGFYAAHVTVAGQDVTGEGGVTLCRIDRPRGGGRLPLYAASSTWDEKSLLAMRNAGVSIIRVAAGEPERDSEIALAKTMRFQLAPRLQVSGCPAEESIAVASALHEAHCGHVAWWELACDGDFALAGAVASGLHRSGCPAPVLVFAADVGSLSKLASNGALKHFDGLVLSIPDAGETDMARARRVLDRAGLERFPVYVGSLRLPEGTRREGPALVRSVFGHLASGATCMALDVGLVYDGQIREALPYVAGLSRRLDVTEYAGTLPASDGVHGLVYRADARWLLVVWCDQDAGEIALPSEGAAELVLTDALNNSLPLPAVEDGVLTLTAGPSPVLLTGKGGPVPGIAARRSALALTRSLVSDEGFAAARQPYLTRFLEHTGALLEADDLFEAPEAPAEGGLRAVLLDMLREFPALEYRWQTDEAPKSASFALAAGLARLVRALCAVEEARGVPFIEPLSDRLASCEEHQSLYLTSQTGDSPFAGRGEQILVEVRRLMAEARSLVDAGRMIEGSGVAALAEWRARSLNALQEGAPLAPPPPEPVAPEASVAEPEPVEEEPPPPEPEEMLEPGQPEGTRKVVHKVVSGDNPSRIADKYGVALPDFMKWNDLTRRSILSIGQELKVYFKQEAE